jgi:uncharacterized DUF497 family protein
MELRLFSRDEAKNEANRKKQGVSFDATSLLFDDEFHISRLERVEAGERPWQTIGMAGDALLLLVAHTWKRPSANCTYALSRPPRQQAGKGGL